MSKIHSSGTLCRIRINRKFNMRLKEPMLLDEFLQRSFQNIAIDLYKVDVLFLIITDYYTRFLKYFN